MKNLTRKLWWLFLGLLKSRPIQGECAKEKGPLLVRYYILNTRWVAIYIHHLLRSDIERHLHDHPWPFVSLILRGGYTEQTPQGARGFTAGSVLMRPALWLHSLELGKPAWTLVVAGPTWRIWGFLVDGRWVPWREYDYAEKERCA
jgi:hypothetical protein